MVNTKNRLFWLIPVIAVLIAVIAGFALLGGGSESKWQAQYDLGVRYLNEMNYEQAILAFTAAIEIDASRADAYLARAQAHAAAGNTEAARADYAAAAQNGSGLALIELLADCFARSALPPANLRAWLDAALQADPEHTVLAQTSGDDIFYNLNEDIGNTLFTVGYRPNGSLLLVDRHDRVGGLLGEIWIEEDGGYYIADYEGDVIQRNASYAADGTLRGLTLFENGIIRQEEFYENGRLYLTTYHDAQGNVIDSIPH